MVRDELAAWGLTSAAQASQLGVVGSSLGGFYATLVANETGCRSVVLNPAVAPARLLAQHIGEQRSFHRDEVFFFRPEFVDELREIDTGSPQQPSQVLAFIAQGDEVLDWREMAQHYAECQLNVLEGGDHALSDYARHLPQAMRFLGLNEHVDQGHVLIR